MMAPRPSGGGPCRLSGACSTMPVPKVTFLDAGIFALVDIDATRLELAKKIAERLVELSGKRWKVEASTARLDVIAGTDYVINSIEVAGLQNVRRDYEIPLRYGV